MQEKSVFEPHPLFRDYAFNAMVLKRTQTPAQGTKLPRTVTVTNLVDLKGKLFAELRSEDDSSVTHRKGEYFLMPLTGLRTNYPSPA